MKAKIVKDKSFGLGLWYVWDGSFGKFLFLQLAIFQLFVGNYDDDSTNS